MSQLAFLQRRGRKPGAAPRSVDAYSAGNRLISIRSFS